MCLLQWRTSLLLAYSNTYLIWLPSGFLNMRPALLSHREEREKYNILIKQNFHFQVVVQFLQFHQQSAKRFKKKKMTATTKDNCYDVVLLISGVFEQHSSGTCTGPKLALYKVTCAVTVYISSLQN